MAATWTVITGRKVSVTSTQATTESAPTLATEGMSLKSVNGFRVSIAADSGQTLSGTGSLAAWLYEEDIARWARSTDLDITVSTSASGLRDWGAVSYQIAVPRGRVAFIATGIGVSSGSVTVTQIASNIYGDEL